MTEDTTTEAVEAPEAVSTTPETTTKRQMSFTVLEDGSIRAEFGEGIDPLFLNPAMVPETIMAAAVTEGLIARARGYGSKLEGAARTPSALREVTAKAFENLLAGVWKIERTGTGSAEYTIEVEAAHLFRIMRGKAAGTEYTGTLAESAENFAKLTEDQKKQIKALPRFQLALAEVKEKRAAEKRAKLEAAVISDEGEGAVF